MPECPDYVEGTTARSVDAEVLTEVIAVHGAEPIYYRNTPDWGSGTTATPL